MIVRRARTLTVVLFFSFPLFSDAKTLAFEPNLSLSAVEKAVESIGAEIKLPRTVYREVFPDAKEKALERFVSNVKTGVANANGFARIFAHTWDVWRDTEVSFDADRALPIALDMSGAESVDPREVAKVAIGVAERVMVTTEEIKLPEFEVKKKQEPKQEAKQILAVEEKPEVVIVQSAEQANTAATVLAQSRLESILNRFRSSSTNTTTSTQTKPVAPIINTQTVPVPAASSVSENSRLSSLERMVRELELRLTRQSDRFSNSISKTTTSFTDSTLTNFSVVSGTFSGGVNIAGGLSLGSATTTTSNGIDISDGCFAIDGVCLSTSGGGGEGTPGGSDTQIQFNDGGSFGGDAGFVYNKTTDIATLINLMLTKSTTTSATTTSLFSTTASSTNLFSTSFSTGSITGTGSLNLGANAITSGDITSSGFIRVGNGSEGAPSISFGTDTNTGIYVNGADALRFTAGGTERWQLGTAALIPSTDNVSDFGLSTFRPRNIYAGTQFLAPNGSLSSPGFSFANDTDTGLYLTGAGSLGIVAGGVEILRIATGTQIGIGTTTPQWPLQLASSTRPQLTLSDPSSLTNSHWSFRNAGGNLYIATSSNSTFATSTTPAISIINSGGVAGLIGFSSTSPWGRFSVEMGSFNPSVVVSNSGSSSPSLYIGGVNQNGHIGIGTSTPQWPLQITDNDQSQLTLSDPSTLINNPWSFRAAGNSFFIATSSPTTFATSTSAFLAFNVNVATTTISFFGATTTGLTAGSGLPLPAALRRQLIIGDGKTQAGIAIVNGGLCVDADGWCSASTTGRVSAVTTTTGGSDLAEIYKSGELLEPGDLVAILEGINVVKASQSMGSKLMGVVATDPGVILGLAPGEDINDSDKYPITLAGRIPTKVSTENGNIKAGDYLTLSSVPGVAAKAIKAGAAIGQALDNYSESEIGKIEVLVKNSYYSGISVDSLLGLETPEAVPDSKAVLASLMSGSLSLGGSSQITTDRLLAGLEIITPKLTAGIVYADSIVSPTIDNLESNLTASLAAINDNLSSTTGAITTRLDALEAAAVTTSNIASVIQSISEWVFVKITAALAIFDRLEVGTAHVSEGLELIDSATGSTYCLTIRNGEWDKAAGVCGMIPASASEPAVEPEPVIVTEPEPAPEPSPAPVEEPEEPAAEPTPEPEPPAESVEPAPTEEIIPEAPSAT